MIRNINKSHGFTIIELLFVIVIISIIVVLSSAKFNVFIDTLVEAKIKHNIKLITNVCSVSHNLNLTQNSKIEMDFLVESINNGKGYNLFGLISPSEIKTIQNQKYYRLEDNLSTKRKNSNGKYLINEDLEIIFIKVKNNPLGYIFDSGQEYLVNGVEI